MTRLTQDIEERIGEVRVSQDRLLAIEVVEYVVAKEFIFDWLVAMHPSQLEAERQHEFTHGTCGM